MADLVPAEEVTLRLTEAGRSQVAHALALYDQWARRNGLRPDPGVLLARHVLQRSAQARNGPQKQAAAPPDAHDRPQPDLIGLDDVAHRLSLSRRTVEALVSDGRLASVKVGARRLVEAAAVEAFIDDQRDHQ